MRIAVLGQGAIGRLVADTIATNREADVVRVDRSNAQAAGSGTVDAVLVCVKTPGTAWAAEAAARLLKPDGIAITLQNGLGNLEILAAALGVSRAGAGSVRTGAYLDHDLVVASGPLQLALARGHVRHQVEALAAILRSAGADVTISDDPLPILWRKLVVNAAANPVSAILGVRNGELLEHAAGALFCDALAAEAARVASAVGVPLGEAEAISLWRDAAAITMTNVSSMLQDVRAHRSTEIDAICGAVAREGDRVRVLAPLNRAVTNLIHLLEPAA